MKKKVMLIEDDQDACLLFRHVLWSAGYEVYHSLDGNYILQSAIDHIDLFILDNSLPNINGVALTKYLKIKQPGHKPVLIISADHSVGHKARKAGASAFVQKPFEVNQFLRVVNDLLHNPEFTFFPDSAQHIKVN